MNKIIILLLISIVTLIVSCSDEKAKTLRDHLQSDYTIDVKTEKLSSGSKAQYIQLEKSINKAYVQELDSLVNTAFERQLKAFEDKELGVWAGYMNMFSWLFKSKQSWNDELRLMSNRYFNSLDINQEQQSLYDNYLKDIRNIRQQFISSEDLPKYTHIPLPTEAIALDALKDHSRNNLVIEFSTELFGWFLGFIIVQIIVLFVDKVSGPIGCLIDIVVFIIIIVVSVIMSSSNDTKLIESLREQQTQTVNFDSNSIRKSLDNNTNHFYESL